MYIAIINTFVAGIVFLAMGLLFKLSPLYFLPTLSYTFFILGSLWISISIIFFVVGYNQHWKKVGNKNIGGSKQ